MKKRNRQKIHRAWILLLVVLGAGFVAVVPVSAHALLVRSNPAANAVLAASPVQVELFFSEAVEPKLSMISVLDSSGQAVDLKDVHGDPDNPERLVVSLRSLADGVYTISWQAISAADGHLTRGAFPFAVGAVDQSSMASAQSSNSQIPISPSTVISKWLLLAGIVFLTGRYPFQFLVWRPALRAAQGNLDPKKDLPSWDQIARLSLIGLLLALVWELLVLAGQMSGLELAWPWAGEAGRVLVGTRLGLFWLARLGLGMILGWLVLSKRLVWKDWGAWVMGLALMLTMSLTSHASAEPQPALPVLADWLHMAGMSAWIGGLAYFVTGMLQVRQLENQPRTHVTSLLIVRFSALALNCVGLLGISGIFSAIMRIGSLDGLFVSLYGKTLLLKLGLTFPLILFGGYNLLVLSPRLRKDSRTGVADPIKIERFRKIITAEVILGMVVILCASLLSSLPPVKTVSTSADLKGSQTVNDLGFRLTIIPGRVGQNTFTLFLTSNGQPVADAKEIVLRFTPSQANLPPSDIQLIGQGDGHFTNKGSNLALADTWQVQAVVRREGKFDAFANFIFGVRSSAANEAPFATVQVAGGLILMAGLAFIFLFLLAAARMKARLVPANLLGGLLVALGLVFLTRPLPVAGGTINPIAPNQQSVQAGQALYNRNCLTCHGSIGKGDGPVGLTLIPRPADLSLHAVPGVHTDAQLFAWIGDGFPGSRMPAFKSSLSESDRWNLVNFIRTLAGK